MSATPAKKPAKTAGPTWSKMAGGSSRAAASTSRPAAKPAARSQSGSRPARSASKAPARKPRPSTAPAFTVPAYVRREIAGLVIVVLALLSMIGLLTWSRGGQGVVGVMGSTLAQLFGVAAWLVPLALAFGGIILLVGAR